MKITITIKPADDEVSDVLLALGQGSFEAGDGTGMKLTARFDDNLPGAAQALASLADWRMNAAAAGA